MRVSLLALIPILGAAAPDARAAGFVLEAGTVPIELRVALSTAEAPLGTVRTAWMSLQFSEAESAVALVLLAPKGTALDLSSPAFFEALDESTAVRVIPPDGLEAECPNDQDTLGYALEGNPSALPKVSLQERRDFAAASEVLLWMNQIGVVAPVGFEDHASLWPADWRWVGLRFGGSKGPAVTPTVRLHYPPASSANLFPLPLSFSHAGEQPLRLALYGIGNGLMQPTLSVSELSTTNLVYFPFGPRSNYDALRKQVLATPGSALLEAGSHHVLGSATAFLSGTASIPSLAQSYFSRAESYGDTAQDAAVCTDRVAQILNSPSTVSSVCPRASLGTIASANSCSEVVPEGTIDPNVLRCGRAAEDFALMLENSVPQSAWLSRHTSLVAAGEPVTDLAMAAADAAPKSPILNAALVDFDGCADVTAPSSSATGVAPSGGNVGSVAAGGPGSGGELAAGGQDSGGEPIGYYTESCLCGPTLAIVDAPSNESETAESDVDCSADTGSDSAAYSNCDAASDEGSDSSCDGSDSAGDSGCSGDSGGQDADCSGGGDDCRVSAQGGRRLRPKFSQLSMLLGGFLLVARRLSRPRKPQRR